MWWYSIEHVPNLPNSQEWLWLQQGFSCLTISINLLSGLPLCCCYWYHGIISPFSILVINTAIVFDNFRHEPFCVLLHTYSPRQRCEVFHAYCSFLPPGKSFWAIVTEWVLGIILYFLPTRVPSPPFYWQEGIMEAFGFSVLLYVAELPSYERTVVDTISISLQDPHLVNVSWEVAGRPRCLSAEPWACSRDCTNERH